MLILLKFDISKKVIAQWNTDHAPEPGLFNATNRNDGPDYMGRTYNPGLDSFSPFVAPDKTRRQELKEKPTWTDAERDEALRELL